MTEVRFDASTVARESRHNQSPYWGEHTARYLFAAPYVTECKVLDIACGTGYGLPVLQETARSVIGGDVDFNAAKKAHAEISDRRPMIVVLDGCNLPFANATFGAITSFETLEHLENRKKFLNEIRRVLKPNGRCIISTPNANYTQPIKGRPRNPHHIHEYTPQELITELGGCFSAVKLFGQHLDPRFAISPFWEDQQRMSPTLKLQCQLLLWRGLNKLPFWSLRDRISRILWRHSFFPAETDYRFDQSRVEGAHVLVAVCHVGSHIAE